MVEAAKGDELLFPEELLLVLDILVHLVALLRLLGQKTILDYPQAIQELVDGMGVKHERPGFSQALPTLMCLSHLRHLLHILEEQVVHREALD